MPKLAFVRTRGESVELSQTSKSDLFCSSKVVMVESPPQFKSVPFFSSCELYPASVWPIPICAESWAEETPQFSGNPLEVELCTVNRRDSGQVIERELDPLSLDNV